MKNAMEGIQIILDARKDRMRDFVLFEWQMDGYSCGFYIMPGIQSYSSCNEKNFDGNGLETCNPYVTNRLRIDCVDRTIGCVGRFNEDGRLFERTHPHMNFLRWLRREGDVSKRNTFKEWTNVTSPGNTVEKEKCYETDGGEPRNEESKENTKHVTFSEVIGYEGARIVEKKKPSEAQSVLRMAPQHYSYKRTIR